MQCYHFRHVLWRLCSLEQQLSHHDTLRATSCCKLNNCFNELFATGYAFSHDGELMAYSLGRYGLHAPRACICSVP